LNKFLKQACKFVQAETKRRQRGSSFSRGKDN